MMDKRIFDQEDNELQEYDQTLGRLESDFLFVKHHDAIEAVEQQSHFKLVEFYEHNGGCDVEEVIDVEEREAKDAWDEYEEIYRYIPFTESEQTQIKLDQLSGQLASTNSVVMEIAEGLSTWDDHQDVQQERADLRKQISELKEGI